MVTELLHDPDPTLSFHIISSSFQFFYSRHCRRSACFMFLSSLIPSLSLLPLFTQIVNKSGPEPSSSYSATAARYRSSDSSTSRSSLRSSSLSSRRYSSHMAASSSTSKTSTTSDPSQALLNINKLKEKVASHGSRVMASFKTEPGSQQATGFQTPTSVSPTPSTSQSDKAGSTSRSSSISKLSAQSLLTNEQLTAHLTQEERVILEKVFQKEEEFHRVATLKAR